MPTPTLTTPTLDGKPDAGKPHVRLDEGEVASLKPRRGSLLYTRNYEMEPEVLNVLPPKAELEKILKG